MSAISEFETTFLGACRPRECAFLMAEQLTQQQDSTKAAQFTLTKGPERRFECSCSASRRALACPLSPG